MPNNAIHQAHKPQSLFAQWHEDVTCVFARDPAARSVIEILLTYSGVHAVLIHRLSHRLWKADWKFLARFISAFSKWLTHVDITIKKPSIDVMKRIIMKTLSECFYFKKLEEDSPVAFKSLTEKLKYFHPAFHSTTPEGLNGRLTFLLQCLRPGDTIPIKGLSDNTDIGARNTTFGPPPICVLRIGDFYHSKIIIKDVNITYEEGVWDFNPEGIGVQPMIANVQLQITFIGGQGLDRPVEKLQNALSSNFFANTEMYDERSIPTDGRIGYENREKFTKEFLQTLNNFDIAKTASVPTDTNKPTQGEFIGTGSGTKLVYTTIVDDLSNVGSVPVGSNQTYCVRAYNTIGYAIGMFCHNIQ